MADDELDFNTFGQDSNAGSVDQLESAFQQQHANNADNFVTTIPSSTNFSLTRPDGTTVSPADYSLMVGKLAVAPEMQGLVVDKAGNVLNSDGTPLNPSQKDGLLKTLGSFFDSSTGRLIGSLALGAAGMGLGKLVAGPGGTLTLPSTTAGQNPVVAAAQPQLLASLAGQGGADLKSALDANFAGQKTLASASTEDIARASAANAQIEAQSAPLRSLAAANLPGYMTGTAPHPSAAYDATTSAAMAQMEKLLGLPTGTLTGAGAAAGGGGITDDQFTAKGIFDPGLRNIIRTDPTEAYNYGLGPNPATTPGAADTTAPAGVTQDSLLPAITDKLSKTMAGGPAAYYSADPVQAQMAARLQNALAGGELDPATERSIREQLDILHNNLKRAYGDAGAEWNSTVGQSLAAKSAESVAALRYGVNRDVVNSLGPQEQARRTFAITNPQNMYLADLGFYGGQQQQRSQLPAAETRALLAQYFPTVAQNAAFNENARQVNVAQNAAITGLNRPTLATGSNALGNQITSLSPLLGVNEPNVFPTLAAASTSAFNAQQAADAAQAKSIADIFGNAAGTLKPATNVTLAPTGTGMFS